MKKIEYSNITRKLYAHIKADLIEKLTEKGVIEQDDFSQFLEFIDEKNNDNIECFSIICQQIALLYYYSEVYEQFLVKKAVELGMEAELVENGIIDEDDMIELKFIDSYLLDYLYSYDEETTNVMVKDKKFTVTYKILPEITDYEMTAAVEITNIEGDESPEMLEMLKNKCNGENDIIYSVENIADTGSYEKLFSKITGALTEYLPRYFEQVA